MALGPYWKKKYKVPFVLDIQDPWRNDYYLDKPRHERPPKFFFTYHIDKYLEARTVPFADAIVSVSKTYCDIFKCRYKTSRNRLVLLFHLVEYLRILLLWKKTILKLRKYILMNRRLI